MNKYENVGSSKIPTISFDPNTGTLEIKGCSIPENAIEFYKPLLEAVDEYSKLPKASTNVTIQLEYFNTSSSKSFLNLFRKLEAIRKDGSAVSITWNYEKDDESMLEAGKEYQEMINVPFTMVEVDG